MAINPHHIIEEIQGVRCSIVEKNVSLDRTQFLKEILEFNRLKVFIKENPDQTYTIGVNNVIFNAVHALYSRRLLTPDRKVVTPAFWFQQKQDEGFYWEYKR